MKNILNIEYVSKAHDMIKLTCVNTEKSFNVVKSVISNIQKLYKSKKFIELRKALDETSYLSKLCLDRQALKDNKIDNTYYDSRYKVLAFVLNVDKKAIELQVKNAQRSIDVSKISKAIKKVKAKSKSKKAISKR